MSTTIHDRVKIIKNTQELDTSAGGGDTILPKHGSTHAKASTDPIPQEIDGIPVDMSGVTDGQVPTYDDTEEKFLPTTPGAPSSTPEFDYVDFKTGLGDPAYKEGRVSYDDTDKSLAYYNDKSDVKKNLGRGLWFRVCNNTLSTLNNGEVVYLKDVSIAGCPEVELALAKDYDKDTVLAMLTMDIPPGQEGEATRIGDVGGVDLTAFSVGDKLFLSSVTPGALTNTRPTWPARPIIVGYVKNNTASGKVLVVIENDQFDYEFDGCAIERQDTFVVVDGGMVYAETELLNGGDLPVQLEGDVHLLDCTSGSGVGGRARVGLTAGTDTAPQINFVFVSLVGGVPTLQSSVTAPTGAYAFISFVSLWSAAKTATDGPALHQRNTDAIEHDGRGRIAHICAKIRQLGASWANGVSPTATIVTQGGSLDDLNLETTVGLVWQLHPQVFPALDSAADGVYVANASGLGTLTNYQKVTNLNQCLEYTDGSAVANNDRFNLLIWGAVNKTTAECKLFVNLSTKGYSTDNNGYYDVDGAAVNSVDRALFSVAFLICRIPVEYRTVGGGTLSFINPAGSPEIIPLLGTPLGSSGSGGSAGGGGGASTLNDLNDVTISSPADGEGLQYNSTTLQWENVDLAIPSVINDLTDVDASSPSGGDLLIFSTENGWQSTNNPFTTLDDLTDTNIFTPTDGQGLLYNSGTGNWDNADLVNDLGDLNDVNLGGVSGGDLLIYNTENGWENSPNPFTTLDDLTDTNIFTPSDGQILVYNSGTGNWDNSNQSAIDHGLVNGLGDDDHTQYLLVNGGRELSTNWVAGEYEIRSAKMKSNQTRTANQILRVTNSSTGDGYAYQAILVPEDLYRVRGMFRSSGSSLPIVGQRGFQNIAVGSASQTWQMFDKIFTCSEFTSFLHFGTSSGVATTWTEFDNVFLEKLSNPGVNVLNDRDMEERNVSLWSTVGTASPTVSKRDNSHVGLMYTSEGIECIGSDTVQDIALRPKSTGSVDIFSDINQLKTNGPYTNRSTYQNEDIDTGTEDVDTFDPGADGTCVWEFYVTNGTTAHRWGTIQASWDYSAGTATPSAEESTPDIGDTSDLSLTVDMSGASGNVRLRATAASDNWKVYGIRKRMIPPA